MNEDQRIQKIRWPFFILLCRANEYDKNMKHFFLSALIFPFAANLFAQTNGKFFLSADSLSKHRQIRIVENWKYQSGDDSTWAKPEFDDSAWETALTWLHPQRMPQAGWNGSGWFRRHLKIDSALVNMPLALVVTQRGAAEIYLDGRLIHRFGKVGTSPANEQPYWERNPKTIIFPRDGVLLAVRYSNFSTRHFSQYGTWMGFGVSVGLYDFHLAEDGTLTVAIGDATGHGTKAGTVVTATKSLFQVLAQNDDSPQVFRRFTQTLKSMNLGRMYMAMTLIKFKDNKIKIAAAGMPPALVYRAATKTVEEINIKAMPLGSFTQFPYKQEELELAFDDTIALMSDGLPEMFNHEGEILDYLAAKNIFAAVAEQSPHEIIARLIKAGETWANGRPQDDDVTFVVMKVTRRA